MPKKIKRKWDILSKEKRNTLTRELITFFREQRDEELGMIAAEEILDFFLQNTAEHIYDKGVEDSKQLIRERFNDIEVDLDLLLSK